jgi:transcriptional regulator with XRE-family HTH domain
MWAETVTSSGILPEDEWRLVINARLLEGHHSMPVTTAADYVVPEPHGSTAAEFPNQLLAPRPNFEMQPSSDGEAILEIRRLSGLTWQELADILGVRRRTLHLWANRRPINAANEHRLQRLLGAMRRLDRGEASRNRSLLLARRAGDVSIFDLLSEGRFDDAVATAGVGQGRQQRPTTPLAPDAVEARRPMPLGQLMGALQDPVHQSVGRLVRYKAEHLRAKKKKV